MMHSDSLMKKTKEMMRVVFYDPHRFLRAIKRCENDDQYSKWFTEAGPEKVGRIQHQAHSVLVSNQLNKEGCAFVLLIEDAVEKIQESPEEKDGFFLSVQEQLDYHKKVLSDVCWDPWRFVWKLKKCGLENHLRDDYGDFVTRQAEESDDYFVEVVQALCNKGITMGPAGNIENIEKNMARHLSNQSSLFFALVEQANHRSASSSPPPSHTRRLVE